MNHLIQWKRRGEMLRILCEKVTAQIASKKPPMATQNQLPLSGLSVFIILKSSPSRISFVENNQPTQALAQTQKPKKSVGNPHCILFALDIYLYSLHKLLPKMPALDSLRW
jgi:hypothetical protein